LRKLFYIVSGVLEIRILGWEKGLLVCMGVDIENYGVEGDLEGWILRYRYSYWFDGDLNIGRGEVNPVEGLVDYIIDND